MDSLTELYESQLVPMDEQLEKQAEEMVKEAEEEDAAGRIMARGFADELNKIAMGPGMHGHGKGKMSYGAGTGGTVPVKPFKPSTSAQRGANVSLPSRTAKSPGGFTASKTPSLGTMPVANVGKKKGPVDMGTFPVHNVNKQVAGK